MFGIWIPQIVCKFYFTINLLVVFAFIFTKYKPEFKLEIFMFSVSLSEKFKFKTRCPKTLYTSTIAIGSFEDLIVMLFFEGFGYIENPISSASDTPND